MKMGVTLTGNRRRKHVRIFSQNCRGLKTKDRLQMIVEELENRNSFAAAVQETWRKGSEALQLAEKQHDGVARAVTAKWKRQPRGRNSFK